jgi:hypothetical protein
VAQTDAVIAYVESLRASVAYGFHFTEAHVAALSGMGLRPTVVSQCEGETVVVPIGCLHQVDNLHCCFKMARDDILPAFNRSCSIGGGWDCRSSAGALRRPLQARVCLVAARMRALPIRAQDVPHANEQAQLGRSAPALFPRSPCDLERSRRALAARRLLLLHE